MDEVRNDGRSPDAKTHCDLLGRGRRASEPPGTVWFSQIRYIAERLTLRWEVTPFLA